MALKKSDVRDWTRMTRTGQEKTLDVVQILFRSSVGWAGGKKRIIC